MVMGILRRCGLRCASGSGSGSGRTKTAIKVLLNSNSFRAQLY